MNWPQPSDTQIILGKLEHGPVGYYVICRTLGNSSDRAIEAIDYLLQHRLIKRVSKRAPFGRQETWFELTRQEQLT